MDHCDTTSGLRTSLLIAPITLAATAAALGQPDPGSQKILHHKEDLWGSWLLGWSRPRTLPVPRSAALSADQAMQKDLKHEEGLRVLVEVWIGPILLREQLKMVKSGNHMISVEAAAAAMLLWHPCFSCATPPTTVQFGHCSRLQVTNQVKEQESIQVFMSQLVKALALAKPISSRHSFMFHCGATGSLGMNCNKVAFAWGLGHTTSHQPSFKQKEAGCPAIASCQNYSLLLSVKLSIA